MVVNEQLIEFLEAEGVSPESASGMACVLDKMDWIQELRAVRDGDHSLSEHRDRFRFLEAKDLLNLPRQEWLVQDKIPRGALVGFVSPPERFKTFTMIDLVLSVAGGGKWLGQYETAEGPAILVLAEGSFGLPKRVAAWKDYCGVEPVGHFVTEAVPLMEEITTRIFIREVRRCVTSPGYGHRQLRQALRPHARRS